MKLNDATSKMAGYVDRLIHQKQSPKTKGKKKASVKTKSKIGDYGNDPDYGFGTSDSFWRWGKHVNHL